MLEEEEEAIPLGVVVAVRGSDQCPPPEQLSSSRVEPLIPVSAAVVGQGGHCYSTHRIHWPKVTVRVTKCVNVAKNYNEIHTLPSSGPQTWAVVSSWPLKNPCFRGGGVWLIRLKSNKHVLIPSNTSTYLGWAQLYRKIN